MASITLSLPDDLASQIQAQQRQLPRILELGLRELNAGRQFGFDGAPAVLELLTALPCPEEVAEIVEKSRASEMTPRDEEAWERYEYREHLARIAKAAAQLKLVFPQAMPDIDAALWELVRSRAASPCEHCHIYP